MIHDALPFKFFNWTEQKAVNKYHSSISKDSRNSFNFPALMMLTIRNHLIRSTSWIIPKIQTNSLSSISSQMQRLELNSSILVNLFYGREINKRWNRVCHRFDWNSHSKKEISWNASHSCHFFQRKPQLVHTFMYFLYSCIPKPLQASQHPFTANHLSFAPLLFTYSFIINWWFYTANVECDLINGLSFVLCVWSWHRRRSFT